MEIRLTIPAGDSDGKTTSFNYISIPSLKIPRTSDAKQPSKSLRFPSSTLLPSSSCSIETEEKPEPSSAKKWCVYLILSTSVPLKTYVGVANDFLRRLRQHNGEINGGAKASRAGRPWVCACIIQGFNDQSETCEFESRWKIFSRKTPSRRSHDDIQEQAEDGPLPLLRRRNVALDKVKGVGVFDCRYLVIDWKRSFSQFQLLRRLFTVLKKYFSWRIEIPYMFNGWRDATVLSWW